MAAVCSRSHSMRSSKDAQRDNLRCGKSIAKPDVNPRSNDSASLSPNKPQGFSAPSLRLRAAYLFASRLVGALMAVTSLRGASGIILIQKVAMRLVG